MNYEICKQRIPSSQAVKRLKSWLSFRNRTGEERRLQTLCDKRYSNFVWNNFSPDFTFL